MKFIQEDLIKAAKAALEMEDEGYKVYNDAANRSKNILGATTLKSIAEKELLHKKAIENFYAFLTGQNISTVAFSDSSQWSEKIKREIFDHIKGKLEIYSEKEDFLLKAYEVAMEMEKRGYDFYKNISSSTDNPEAKKLFEFLAKEENIHFEILQDTHLYLSNPAEWFKKEEKWLVEG